MILSSTSDSKKIKAAINAIIKEMDFHLCCEIIPTKVHKRSFVVKNWVIDEDDFYVAHVMYKKRRSNWATLMDIIPILGEVWIHYDFFGNGQCRVTDGMSRMERVHYHWKTGLDYLEGEGYFLDKAECYKYMLEQTTKWSENESE